MPGNSSSRRSELSPAHEIVECAQGFFQRRLRIRKVGLVKVDGIRPQPAQTVLGGFEDVPTR